MTATAPPAPGAPWRLTWPAQVMATAAVVILVLGVLGGRPDVALLGAGPLLAVVWSTRWRIVGDVDVIELARTERDEAEVHRLQVQVQVTAPEHTHVRLRIRRPGSAPVERIIAADGLHRALEVSTPSVRSGQQPLFTVDYLGMGPGAVVADEPGRLDPTSVLVFPVARPLPALPLPFRLRGLTGSHSSRRPGDGGELRDIHPFTPGDRLRRIDWRVTAKRSPDLTELYVRRSLAQADSVVMLVVDSRDDIGPDPATWSGAVPLRPDERSSLDLSREAVLSVARAAIGYGDRVGLQDLGDPRGPLAPGAGRRQVERISWRLVTTVPAGRPSQVVRAPNLPSGSLVIIFSTFLDPHVGLVASKWRGTGHRVVAVDTLPPLYSDHLSPRERLAARMVRIERTDRLVALASQGVELFAWLSTGDVIGPGIGADSPEVEILRLARRGHNRPGMQVGA